jgi:hypothetical protein
MWKIVNRVRSKAAGNRMCVAAIACIDIGLDDLLDAFRKHGL